MNNSIPRQNMENRFALHWAIEAFEKFEPIKWLVESRIIQGSLNLFVGEPGSKKTLTALDLAVSIAMGTDWIGKPTSQGTVLIIDEESGSRRLRRYMARSIRGHLGEKDTPIAYSCLANYDLRDIKHTSILRGLIEETKAKLVIIDALSDVMPGADENTVKDVMPMFILLRAIAEDLQVTFVIIHHTNKSGGYRGSSALKGAVDMLMKIESEPNSNFITYTTEKVRDFEPYSFSAKAHFSEDQFWLSSSEYKAGPKIGKAKRHVLLFLMENGPSKTNKILEKPEICTKNAARNAIFELASDDHVTRIDKGGPGQIATYGLTKKGEEMAKSISAE